MGGGENRKCHREKKEERREWGNVVMGGVWGVGEGSWRVGGGREERGERK